MSRCWKLAGVGAALWASVALPTMRAGAQGAAPGSAHGAATHVALGDSAYTQRRAAAALAHYRQAIAAEPGRFDAYWKASRTEVDLAETAPKGRAMDSLLASAQLHAEAAIRLNARSAEGQFALARAIGRRALSVGTMDRIRYSKVVRAAALAALAADSTHAGALHVLGMWNAEIMRVNGLARAFAKTFLGAQVFGLASWDEAQRLLEASVRVDPDRIVHRLDLAGIYADRGDKDRARTVYRWIAGAPIMEPNDDLYKRQATERLAKL